jgi:hypothetical protein
VNESVLLPSGWFDAWWNATVALDPVGAVASPPVLRVPNGALADDASLWGAARLPSTSRS